MCGHHHEGNVQLACDTEQRCRQCPHALDGFAPASLALVPQLPPAQAADLPRARDLLSVGRRCPVGYRPDYQRTE